MLFQEANMGSNNIGVVVNPVRLTSLEEFGTPQFVADKLIQAERRKVTLCSNSAFFLYGEIQNGSSTLSFKFKNGDCI